jgi:HPt (histidine-containing phosphotransfer) domain-containing protein
MNAESEPPGLDPAALERLRELDPDGRHGVIRRVLLAYEGSLARMLLQFRSELGQGRAAAVAQLAHTLKSSSASVGALALSQQCADVERRHRVDHAEGLDDDLRLLITESELALLAVRAMLEV